MKESIRTFLSSSLCDGLFGQCLPEIVFFKTYDLQYLKQMSMALYFSHPIFIELARYGFRTLPLSYPDRGKLIFVTALFGSHLFGLAMLWVRDRREKQKIPSNGEELDEITNQ